MNFLETPYTVTGTNGAKVGEGVWVIGGACAHCRHPIGEEMVLALGRPHLALLHWRCAPYFQYRNTWPHSRPLEAYVPEPLQLE